MKKLTIILLTLLLTFAFVTDVGAETFRQGSVRNTFNPVASTTQTSAYTVTSSDSLVNVTCSSADIVITLPTITSLRSSFGNKNFKILKTDATAYAVIVTPGTNDTIGGESTRYILTQNAYVVISMGSDDGTGTGGSDWEVIYESPYTVEDYESGTHATYGTTITHVGDQVVTGTTPTLTIGDGGAEDTTLIFDGDTPAANDTHFGVDNTDGYTKIGLGQALGTDARITIVNTVGETQVILGDGVTAVDTILALDGNAQDYHVCLDDTDDDLKIGLGVACGTTPAITIDENQVTTVLQDAIFSGTTPTVTIGDAGAEDAAIVFDGNAQDFYVGLDDTADDLVIGLGSALGTTQAIGIDSGLQVTFSTSIMYPTETVTATNSIAATECGTTYFLASATEFASTLPAISTVSAGCYFKFVIAAAPSGASYTIITGNSLENVLIGGINELEVDTSNDGPYNAAGDTITSADGLGAVGDWVSMISDGTSYYITGQANLDGGLEISQAD
jgi:hypothetical protein